MPIDPTRLCPCHGVPMYHRPDGKAHTCVIKRRQSSHRYNLTEKRRAAALRYFATDKGQQYRAAGNRRRLYVAHTYLGRVRADQVPLIKAHIARRLDDFKRSLCPSPVTADKRKS